MLLFKISEMVSDTADTKEENTLGILTDMDSSNIKKSVPSLEHFANWFLIFSSRCPISIPVDLPPAPTFWKNFHNIPISPVSLWPIKTKPFASLLSLLYLWFVSHTSSVAEWVEVHLVHSVSQGCCCLASAVWLKVRTANRWCCS